MPRFAANLTMLYGEHAFLDRFAAAAADGFAAVEFLFPYAFSAPALAARLQQHQLRQVLFNAPPGDWAAGERGLACLPQRVAEFRSGFAQALEYAAVLDCPRIHVMAGCAPAGADAAALHDCYLENLHWAAARARAGGREVLIEPINQRDMPGYFLRSQAQAHAVVEQVGAPNLHVQMDLYHCQLAEGDLASRLQQYLPGGRVGHIQIAGVPQRHEPDQGELNCVYLLDLLDALGYSGHVGCEYWPQLGAVPGGTSAGLGWLRRWQALPA